MPRLVIVSVNDVYILDNFPRLASLIQRWKKEPADLVIFPLAGDFVAPSLLSSIDAGRGMIDCMNAVGITHVVLGNHEDDIPPAELKARLKELNAVCIGTNILSGLDLPRHVILDVGGTKVGLVGVVMEDPAVYRGKPFGGAELVPANASAREEAAKLLAEGCRSVIPMTHQSVTDDRALAEAQRDPPFPAIIGGHEHTPMLIDVEGTWIVKAGMDATSAVITDITWSSAGAPTVTTKLESVADYPEDAAVRARVDMHNSKVAELATATLFYFAPGEHFSSVGTRKQQTTIGALICSKLRDCLGAHACVFNGGGIRASKNYDHCLTYGDLEAEVPFDNEIVSVPIHGRALAEAVKFSRSKAPALESGGYLQVDDRMTVSAENDITAVDGEPFDPNRVYDVAMPRALMFGLDHVEPLVQWAKANEAAVPPAGSGREPKILLVQAFAIEIWRELGSFDDVDANHDEQVTPQEIAAAVAKKHPQDPPSTVLADLVLRALDVDSNHVLTRKDVAAIPPPKKH